MAMLNTGAKTINAYIKVFPKDVQPVLKKVRTTIKAVVPKADEAIKYAIPTFIVNGKNLVHFAAYKNHIGFYPAPSAIVKFKKELAKYETSKGAIKFPLTEPIPYPLIKKITQYRLKESLGLV